MMNSFSPFGSGIGFLGLAVHVLFCLVTIVGFFLLCVYAVRFLNRQQMKSLVTWLLALGILGALLTGPFSGMGGGWISAHMGNRFGGWQQQGCAMDEDAQKEMKQFFREMLRTPTPPSDDKPRT